MKPNLNDALNVIARLKQAEDCAIAVRGVCIR
jgi:hypothetical protein